jgi:hypothetical protein
MASGSGVEVTAWVKIGDGATIDYHLCEEGKSSSPSEAVTCSTC